MKGKKLFVLSICLLFVLTLLNIATFAARTTTIRVKGTGNAYEETKDGRTTWGCDRLNENDCSMTIIITDK